MTSPNESKSFFQVRTAEDGLGGQIALEATAEAIDKDADWAAAQVFLHKGPSASLEFLEPDLRAHLYAYQAQARDGPFPEGEDLGIISDYTLRRKQEAWKALDGMTKEVAKRELVGLLDRVLPEWRSWYAQNSLVVSSNHQGGEAERLLGAFAKRNAMSKL